MLQLFNYNGGKGDWLRLRFEGLSGRIHNIMIDAGVIRSGPRFHSVCSAIGSAGKITGETIDLCIITHVDDDHLGGLLYNMRLGKRLPIAEIRMNSQAGMSSGLSVRQNNELYGRLSAAGIPVKTALAGENWEIDGAQLEILWPLKKAAENFYITGVSSNSFSSANLSSTYLARRSDYGYDLSELMEKPIKEKDSSLNNRNSIIFAFTYEDKRFLFTGDAWSEDILAVVEGRKFDCVKLPHHGSVRNISEDWRDKLPCKHFLICTDGVSHPDKQTVAKLLKWNGEITIYGSVSWWEKGFLTDNDKNLSGNIHFIQGEQVSW